MLDIPLDYTVTAATVVEVIEILKEPRLLEAVGLEQESDIPRFIRHGPWSRYYILAYEQYYTLVVYKKISEGIFEIHLACPAHSVKACRVLMPMAAHWVAEKEPTAKALTTSCPEGKIANTLRKLGCKELNTEGSRVYFCIACN